MSKLLLAIKQVFCFHKWSFQGSIAQCVKCGERCFHENIQVTRIWNGFKEHDYEKDRPEKYAIKCHFCSALFFEDDGCDFHLFIDSDSSQQIFSNVEGKKHE